ncbi:hypothetical protein CPC08DRAFT_708653, partial [Agrocybe pediades]
NTHSAVGEWTGRRYRKIDGSPSMSISYVGDGLHTPNFSFMIVYHNVSFNLNDGSETIYRRCQQPIIPAPVAQPKHMHTLMKIAHSGI